MAREMKPGKKFRYDLETVLKVRKIKEKKEQEEFAKRTRDYMTEKEKQEKIEREKQDREKELRSILGKGPIQGFERVMQRKMHLGILKDERDKQEKKTDEANERLEAQRQSLVTSMKDRKVMERHRENTLKKYQHLMRQVEGKTLDETAVLRHARKKPNA